MHLLNENKELIGEVSCHILAAEHKESGLYIRMTLWQRCETLQKMCLCWQPNNQSAMQT